MRLSRSNFINYVFQPYNQAVKTVGERYSKIDYPVWKEIRSWLYDDKWKDYSLRLERENSQYVSIGLYSKIRICPEAFLFDIDDEAFGSWIDDHYYDIALHQSMEYATCANGIYNIGYSANALSESITSLGDTFKKLINENGYEKENENNMKFGNFDFGPVDSSVRMSMYGMAIKNASGTYVAYDKANDGIVDVDIFNFEGANKFIYKMPAAIKDIAVGDVVIHARKPMFVQEILENDRLLALDIFDGEEKTIVLTRSMFGFNFITKVVSLIDFAGAANADTPVGNMWPLMLMSDGNSKDLLPMMFLMNQGSATMNPLMMYALMGDTKGNDMLPLLMMSGALSNKGGCTCGGNCSCHSSK